MNWRGRHRWIWVYLCLSLMAHATDSGVAGFDVRWNVPPTGRGIYGVHSATPLPRHAWSVASQWDISRDIVTAVMPARATTVALIQTMVIQDVAMAYGIADRWQVGVGVPLVWEEGTNVATLGAYQALGVGDVRAAVLWNAIPDRTGTVGMSLESTVSFPTGRRELFVSSGAVTWEGRALLQKTWQPVSLFANVGYRVLPHHRVLATENDDRAIGSVGLDVPVPWRNRVLHVRAELAAATMIAQPRWATTPVEARVGLRAHFASGLTLDVGGGARLTAADGAPTTRFLFGVGWDRTARRHPVQRQTASMYTSVYFPSNSARILPSNFSALRAVGQALAAEPGQHVWIEGHTDARGPAHVNLRLSQRRARNVWQYLQYFGADPQQGHPVGYGERDASARHSAAQRRVDVHALQKIPTNPQLIPQPLR